MTKRLRDMKAGALTIGKLAHAAGVNAGTVRFYERAGLLHMIERTAAGYRVYERADIDRVQFIRRAKELGFTLDEIAQLLVLNEEQNSSSIRAAAEQRLAEVESKLAEMVRVRDALRSLVESCRGNVPAGEPSILQALVQKPDATAW